MDNPKNLVVNIFENPENRPLETLTLIVESNGTKKAIPALSDFWVENRQFQLYESPNIYDDDEREIIGAKSTWMEIINYLNEDIEWLLSLPQHKFWSNLVHNKSIIESLGSFLMESPTFYTIEKFPNDKKMLQLLEKLRRNVLITFARIVTYKESSSEFMDKSYHGGLIYNNYLMTVPIMWDLCQIYGRENDRVVTKILESAIKLNPLYSADFKEAVEFICQVFTNNEEKFSTSEGKDVQMQMEEIQDLVVHLLDTSTTLEIFLKVYRPAVSFFSTENFLTRLVTVYGNVLPEIYKQLERFSLSEETLIEYTEIRHFLGITRISMINVCRDIIYRDIAVILEQPDPSKDKNAHQCVDKFMNQLTIAVAEKYFLKDYNTLYPIDVDLDIITQISEQVDKVKKNFILKSVFVALEMPEAPKNAEYRNGIDNSIAGPSFSRIEYDIPPENPENSVKSIEKCESALISEVKDIMCDLGEGFIAKCLKYYNNNPSAVINALLEDNLPPELKEVDRQLPYIPRDPMEASAAVDEALGSQRLNVFDGDEFDVMTRDNIDKTRVYKGKRRDKYRNLNEMLNDKTFKNNASSIYEKYGIIEDEYDDEYDDTYDGQDVGPKGVDDPLELGSRPFTTPRVLRAAERPDESSEEEANDPGEDTKFQARDGKGNFCENPEVLRARAEQRRLSKQNPKQARPQTDVVGKPKGQGNEKDVLVNRDRKNTHKASRGNHNRRTGAEWKRRQGMVPS